MPLISARPDNRSGRWFCDQDTVDGSVPVYSLRIVLTIKSDDVSVKI